MSINPSHPEFDLHKFFPYLVRVFYRSVSDSLAHIYTSKFNLSVSEWRVIVTLGANNVFSASEIVERSSVTKVNVSRATKSLQNRGLLKRDINGTDKRRAALRLTESGREIYATLVPLVTVLEEELLKDVSAEEISALLSTMSKIRTNAETVIAANTKNEKSAR